MEKDRAEGVEGVDAAMATIERVVELRAEAEKKLRLCLRAGGDVDMVTAAEQDVARSLRMASIAHHNVNAPPPSPPVDGWMLDSARAGWACSHRALRSIRPRRSIERPGGRLTHTWVRAQLEKAQIAVEELEARIEVRQKQVSSANRVLQGYNNTEYSMERTASQDVQNRVKVTRSPRCAALSPRTCDGSFARSCASLLHWCVVRTA
jgi:hypothetical protein